MKLTKNLLLVASIIASFTSCDVHESIEVSKEVIDSQELQNLDIPDRFDFSTEQQINVTINDNGSHIKYDVYAYSNEKKFVGMETYENQEGEIVTDSVFKSDVLDNLVFSGVPYNGQLSQTITIPKYYKELYIRRKDNLKYSASIETITGDEVNYTASSSTGKLSSSKSSVTDLLYCVNGSAELFQVDPLDGNLTYLSDMPMGSYTCAIDQENKIMYSIGRSSPYPLMKYDIENNSWSTVANYGKGGPRLGYNSSDNLLYFSHKSKLYTINPATGADIDSWDIIGLHNLGGGDLSFADDGTLYLCTFSGLYRLELDTNNVYQSTRISADNLPFNPTSMTIDSNQELWLANNSSSSSLVIMDTVTGGWQYNYGIDANNNTDFDRAINDLSTLKIVSNVVDLTDTDNDGIIDSEDEFPEDDEKAFEVFTPSKYGWGTLAFEDLWPTTGDYDFNDVAIKYKAIAVLNAQNLAVQLDFIYTVKANGAGFNNGFGIEFETVAPSLVESVIGTDLKQNYISLSSNGIEASQDNAVVILFDNAASMLNKEVKLSVIFTEPISTATLGTAPFNPFMIVNETREKEIHLPYRERTSLGETGFEVNGHDRDADGNYVTDTGLPWGINIVHDFKVPKERVPVNQAYNFFNQWASSGGRSYVDWYKDNPGHRNTDKIQN